MYAFRVFVQNPCSHLDVKPYRQVPDQHCWFCGLEVLEIVSIPSWDQRQVERWLLDAPRAVRSGFMARATDALVDAVTKGGVKAPGQGFEPQ
jgi:hypothetical protein